MSKRKEIIFVNLGIVLILILISIIINDKPVYKNTDSMLSIYLQDINGEYHKQERREFPKEGYSLDKAQSYCENESKIYYKDGKIKVKGNKTDKCYIYFTNDNIVRDLSGNHYDGIIQNGGKVQVDEEGNQGLYFDGVDDFVDIVDLPETINWADGFTIEFEAKWLALNNWSRILDFGNGAGSDIIAVTNVGISTTLRADVYKENISHPIDYENFIKLQEKQEIKIETKQDGNSFIQNVYENDQLIENRIFNNNDIVRNVLRTSNYLGKSNWSWDGYFNGYIYNLKIIDAEGNIILWYDFTEKLVKDLSKNNYNGFIQNGGKVQVDEEGNQGLYFDGVDDFVDIVDLPETINWADGFQYEFEAEWLAFNSFSRIFEFGNGSWSDNIFFSTYGTNNAAFPSVIMNATVYDFRTDAITNLEINKIVKIFISYEKTIDGFVEKNYKDGMLLHEHLYTTNEIIRNIRRTNNYLGKSNSEWDEYFKGYIYNLKITDAEGNVILWYDFT